MILLSCFRKAKYTIIIPLQISGTCPLVSKTRNWFIHAFVSADDCLGTHIYLGNARLAYQKRKVA